MTNEEIATLIQTGNNEMLKDVLSKDTSVAFEKTASGISLLQFAAYCRNKIAVELLRKHKSRIDIFEAVCVGDDETVKQHIEVNALLVNSFSPDGFTPLGLACFFGHYDAAKYLIENGANVNTSSKNQFNVAPIHSSCAISNYEE